MNVNITELLLIVWFVSLFLSIWINEKSSGLQDIFLIAPLLISLCASSILLIIIFIYKLVIFFKNLTIII